ncbi:MAG TPA: tRNA (N6-threonylcarbamoyladenosine(37)-N6)-methyltransferase TrmO [Gammaproteobacteria bacterium]|nr:tRNA (N6-threonylcarbamoyladenosine(37)-N6)-methyltransferase TrmO [Gammaproteobacteria bacterium]
MSRPESPPAPITLRPIGYVHTGAAENEIHRQRRTLESEIIIDEDFAPALEGIEAWSHLFVLFYMHKVDDHARMKLQTHPRGREDIPLQGVFTARGRDRPNPIGLAVVELLSREGARLKVRRLDAYDGTPVLDIKPYDTDDVFNDLRLPAWWTQLKGR